ncbi:hypothetical protein V498_00964 [Pseudogymnoascus sp. VKM F-4517 (FW-2822)]|nr:hypothetical protein V498_00964 [Pseudogymnoascus sp. VKM F-4517 (FW-2822)]
MSRYRVDSHKSVIEETHPLTPALFESASALQHDFATSAASPDLRLARDAITVWSAIAYGYVADTALLSPAQSDIPLAAGKTDPAGYTAWIRSVA